MFANHFLDLANAELHKNIIGFDEETIRIFQSYSWPGNLRQMKNVVKYATLLVTGRYITPHELPDELFTNEPASAPLTLRNGQQEWQQIQRALETTGNNKKQAAQLLGIDRKTLYNKLKIYQLKKNML